MRFCEAPCGCKYPVFSTDKITKKGYCRIHSTKYRTDLDRRTIIQKAVEKQNRLENKVRSLGSLESNKEQLTKVKSDYFDENLYLYYKLGEALLAKHPFCAECNSKIEKEYYSEATAHILLKSKFHSVRADPNNMLFLCAHNGCHHASHRWDTFSAMDVWPIAVEKFKLLYPFIDDSEKKNIPYVLWKELPLEYELRYGHKLTMK